MTKLFFSDTFKIVLVGSFATVISLGICGTIIELNQSPKPVQNASIVK